MYTTETTNLDPSGAQIGPIWGDTGEALADANRGSLRAISQSHHDAPPDPDAEPRRRIESLAAVAPSIRTASALLLACSARPVPIDPSSGQSTAEPLTSLQAVADHFQSRLHDGVAVAAGHLPSGSSVFAVTGVGPALRSWWTSLATEPVQRHNEDGLRLSGYANDPAAALGVPDPGPSSLPGAQRTYRSGAGAPMTVCWQAPPVRARSGYAFGGRELAQLDDEMKHGTARRAAAERALLVWCVDPDVDGCRLLVRSRNVAKGVQVVGEGELIPWHVRRADGWSLAAPRVPIATGEQPAPWLLDAVGGRWTDTKGGGAR